MECSPPWKGIELSDQRRHAWKREGTDSPDEAAISGPDRAGDVPAFRNRLAAAVMGG